MKSAIRGSLQRAISEVEDSISLAGIDQIRAARRPDVDRRSTAIHKLIRVFEKPPRQNIFFDGMLFRTPILYCKAIVQVNRELTILRKVLMLALATPRRGTRDFRDQRADVAQRARRHAGALVLVVELLQLRQHGRGKPELAGFLEP
jgi:hypothetical protein